MRLRKYIIAAISIIVLLLGSRAGYGQHDSSIRTLFRISHDNDFINLRLKPSDEAYTAGLRLDYFRVRNQRSGLFSFLPRAGQESVNTDGWSLMQVMYSPRDIERRIPDSTDYPFSGGLFVTRSLHSSNPVKKYSLRSEILAGVMGPPSLAKQSQRFVHRLIGYLEPRGWDYQLKTDLLLNIGFTAEKMIHDAAKGFEIIGGADARAGTMYNAASAYVIFRAGQQEAYFNGLIPQVMASGVSRKANFCFLVIPRAEVLFYNALIDGGLLRRWSGREIAREKRPAFTTTEFSLGLSYGVSFAWKKIGASVMQHMIRSATEDLGLQEFGNISVYFSF
ncbi:MAG: lipid A deacylase LpxR family protein [Chitinophagaceae bacterium]|nr:MAG: lipid A deacylase LpxR family protein [Chitinophagaceae bacterium]